MPTRYRCEDSVIAMIDQTKVLRFYAQWDDRSSMFGQKLEYIINYFLQDDKIEVSDHGIPIVLKGFIRFWK